MAQASALLFLWINRRWILLHLLGRPTYISADLYFTRLSSFFRQLISELAERNSTIFGHMVGSRCNLKMHVRILGYPTPLQTGGQKTLFGRLRNSTAALTAYIFGIKHDINNQASACKLQEVCYIVSKRHELWSKNGVKLEMSFHPPSVKSAFHFIARLRRWRSVKRKSTTLCQTAMVGRSR